MKQPHKIRSCGPDIAYEKFNIEKMIQNIAKYSKFI